MELEFSEDLDAKGLFGEAFALNKSDIRADGREDVEVVKKAAAAAAEDPADAGSTPPPVASGGAVERKAKSWDHEVPFHLSGTTSNLLQLKGVRAKSTFNLSPQDPSAPPLVGGEADIKTMSKLSRSMAQLHETVKLSEGEQAAPKKSPETVQKATWNPSKSTWTLKIPVEQPRGATSKHSEPGHPQEVEVQFTGKQQQRGQSTHPPSTHLLHPSAAAAVAEKPQNRKNSFVQFEKWLQQVFNPDTLKDAHKSLQVVGHHRKSGKTSKHHQLSGSVNANSPSLAEHPQPNVNADTNRLETGSVTSRRSRKSLAPPPPAARAHLEHVTLSDQSSPVARSKFGGAAGYLAGTGSSINDILVKFMLLLLASLFLANSLMFYKLWGLEERLLVTTPPNKHKPLHQARASGFDPLVDNVLKFSEFPKGTPEGGGTGGGYPSNPANPLEWMKLLHRQELVHQLEMEKWHDLIGAAAELLRQTETSLQDLQKSIHPLALQKMRGLMFLQNEEWEHLLTLSHQQKPQPNLHHQSEQHYKSYTTAAPTTTVTTTSTIKATNNPDNNGKNPEGGRKTEPQKTTEELKTLQH